MKYLVAIRNSPCSETAFRKVVGIIDKERDLLFFVCVIPKASHSNKDEKARKKKLLREQANALISSYRERSQELGIRHTGTVIVGDPRSVLLDHVKKVHADCLVIGRRRDRPVMGGVSSYVTQNCPCSVMILKSDANGERLSSSIELTESDREPFATSTSPRTSLNLPRKGSSKTTSPTSTSPREPAPASPREPAPASPREPAPASPRDIADAKALPIPETPVKPSVDATPKATDK